MIQIMKFCRAAWKPMLLHFNLMRTPCVFRLFGSLVERRDGLTTMNDTIKTVSRLQEDLRKTDSVFKESSGPNRRYFYSQYPQ